MATLKREALMKAVQASDARSERFQRPYVRRTKIDAADADALLRANQDADLKPVPVKNVNQQALQGLHRIRSQYDKTRKQRINMVHGLLAEFGLKLPKATTQFGPALGQQTEHLPETLRQALLPIIEEISNSGNGSSRLNPNW